MSYRIISADDSTGLVVFEIAHCCGYLEEQLSTANYPTSERILAYIEQRDKQVNEEVGKREAVIPVPDEIKKMLG